MPTGSSLETKFTQNDLAKYPFLKETADHMKLLDLKIEDLTNPELARILKRAQERLQKSVLFISPGDRSENDIEIPSFPVALMLAIATKNVFIKKRYALAEAKQAFSHLRVEPNYRLVTIAQNFNWNITLNKNVEIPFEFSISFTDYLRNVAHLRDGKWKLINRLLVDGKVYLNQHDVARLLEEEIQRRIEERLDAVEVPTFPAEIEAIAEHITLIAKEKIGESEMDGFPKAVSQSAFPPCIEAMYDAASKGKHMSHIARFTLTSFLVAVGMPPNKVAEAFKTSSDYNARLTRYQVEHIAGSKGSGTRYTPPSCSTLQTHGVCVNSDELCRSIRHPLKYYLKKQKYVPTTKAS